ncbi:MAG: hypothetical protein II595_05465 [Desulfovibrio sp.]|nr:hypothetical protein [Desulfovibrio sp.]
MKAWASLNGQAKEPGEICTDALTVAQVGQAGFEKIFTIQASHGIDGSALVPRARKVDLPLFDRMLVKSRFLGMNFNSSTI